MIDLSQIQEFSFVLIIALSVLLGFGVLAANHKSAKNISYFFVAMTMIMWIVFGHLVYYPAFQENATLIGRLNLFSVALWFVTIYIFILFFPWELRQNKWKPKDIVFLSIGAILATISLSTNLIVKEVQIDNSEIIWRMGSLVNVYYLYAITTAIIIVYRLVLKYRIAKIDERAKIRSFFYGILLVVLFNIVFNVVYPTIFKRDDLYWLGDQSIIFLLGFTAYAIYKQKMFDIKMIATEAIVMILSIALFVEIFISSNVTEMILKGMIWLIASYGGLVLIKSVRKEIEQREKLAKLSDELEKANAHLKEIDKLKDDFLSMASHELNTPIAAIEGYLSMILQEGIGGKIPAKTREYLQSVFLSSQRLAHLVKDLLNVSRIESGRIHIIYEQKQIEDVIDQAIMEVMSKAREANHNLTFVKPKKKMPMTWIDVTRITEILINIMGNAIKYTPNSGKITVKCVNDDEKIVVSVEDNGKGIPKERAKAVFEKFTQVDVMKDEVKGTGLGMYIAKKFIELMHGKIWFKSDGAGKGSTFYFSLPIVKNKPFDPHEGEDAVLH